MADEVVTSKFIGDFLYFYITDVFHEITPNCRPYLERIYAGSPYALEMISSEQMIGFFCRNGGLYGIEDAVLDEPRSGPSTLEARRAAGLEGIWIRGAEIKSQDDAVQASKWVFWHWMTKYNPLCAGGAIKTGMPLYSSPWQDWPDAIRA